MVRACRQYTTEMGETGAGITREEQIDMGLTNEFTTKWGASLPFSLFTDYR